MTHRMILTSAVWMMGSFGLTLAIMLPARVGAADPNSPGSSPTVSPPRVFAHGVELSLQYMGHPTTPAPSIAYNTDSPLVLTLKAVNTTGQTVHIPAAVRLSATRVTSPLSRTLPREEQIYDEEKPITVAPNDSVTTTISPNVKLPRNSIVKVSLASGQQSVPAMSLAVNVQPPQPNRAR